ncbi:MAG: protein kinase [Gemmatimonadetes bacterium]|nr:protein kinase [Gemmatimonadota bacterium]
MVDSPQPVTDPLVERLYEALGSTYHFERELGGGGMSRVFLARERSLDRRVVIKVLPEALAEGLSVDRFRREILLAAGLQHPNIVPVIAAGDAGGLPWFVMPFVEGESLRARVTRGPMLIPEAVAVLRDVGRALAYAHARGIIHRDIKPDNILLTGGAAVVVDFGVAKAVADAGSPTGAPAARTLTRVGMSLGTPAYMAPEQVVADPAASQQVDLYALGITAFEMLTGRVPFAGGSLQEVMSAHLTQAPERLEVARPGTPAALVGIVQQCLAKDPAQRPAGADAFLRLLDDPAVVSGAVPSLAAMATPVSARGGRRALAGWAAAAGLALAAGTWWFVSRREATPAATPMIAVLPLDLASADTSDAYLAQGIADEVLGALGRVPGIRVASRLATRTIAASATPADAARSSGVTLVLEGSVQRRGDRVRVTAQLADPATGATTWSETYDRPGHELYALQGEIASSVAAVVRADVVRDAPSRAATPRDAVAYDEYLRGHFLLARRSPATIQEAITRFEKAIARDPSFAPAHAELAQALAVLPLYTGGGTELVARAQAAAERALSLDSTLAPAHAAQGYLHNAAWRWADGRRSLERAVAIDSSDVTALQWLAENYLLTGQPDAARRTFAAASRLDPSSPIPAALEAVAAALGGDADAGIQLGRRVVDAHPSQAVPRFMLGTVLSWAGRHREAIEELREARRLAPGVLAVIGTLGQAHARSGEAATARALLAELRRTPSAPGVQPAIAKILVALGDRDGAMAALESALAQRDGFFASEPVQSPIFQELTGHARWPALLAAAGVAAGR